MEMRLTKVSFSICSWRTWERSTDTLAGEGEHTAVTAVKSPSSQISDVAFHLGDEPCLMLWDRVVSCVRRTGTNWTEKRWFLCPAVRKLLDHGWVCTHNVKITSRIHTLPHEGPAPMRMTPRRAYARRDPRSTVDFSRSRLKFSLS